MRRSFQLVSLAISLVFIANSALAQKKPKGKKKDTQEGPSAAATWTDPTENEKSDKGPYTPHKEEDEEDAKQAPKAERRPDKGRKRDKLDVFGQVLIGFGRAPQNQPSYEPGSKGTAIGFLLGGRYDFTPAVSVGLRAALTTATVKRNSGNLSSTVFGSPELFGEYRLSLGRLTTVPIGLGVGIPVAQGDYGYRQENTPQFANAYVNRLADATSGWKDSELFTPKHLPIVVSGGIRHEREDWELHGDLKFVMLPALGTTVQNPLSPAPNLGTYKINSFALREVTTLGGSYNFLAKPLIYAGLDLSFVWTPIETFVFDAEGDSDAKPTSLQAVLEPRIGARFGKISPSLAYIAPLGGRLGDASVGGIRLRVDALF